MGAGKVIILAVIMLMAGCGVKSGEPLSPGGARTASPQPAQSVSVEKAPVKNEPKILINGTSLKKKIDNFAFTSDMKTMLFEEVKGSGFAIFEMQDKGGQWSDPVTPTFSNPSVSEGSPFLTNDNQKVFFHSFRALSGQKSPSAALDLWVAERTKQGWTEPKPVGIPKGNPADFYYYPSVSDNGTVYFTSFRSDSKGKDDIYRSRFVNGSYQEPEHLGDAINSTDIDGYPYIAADESFLVFGRSNDLFVSYNREGSWSQAKALGLNQFGIRKLRSPTLSKDRKQLLFIGEKDGVAHIYQVGWPIT